MRTYSRHRVKYFGLFMFVVMIPALIYLPSWIDRPAPIMSAAGAEGYNNQVAYLLSLAWIISGTAGAWFLSRGEDSSASPAPETIVEKPTLTSRRTFTFLVTLAVCLLYFPPALAEKGPMLEECIHLTAIQRMLGGDVPYRDFEFLYGPLMLYPAYWWVSLTSFSLTAFYFYVAGLELLVFLLLLRPFQKRVPSPWIRMGAFLLLASLCFNTMLGPNQNGLRKLVGILLLFGAAQHPFNRSLWILHGIILGALFSYSQDFGAATALGFAGIYGTIVAKQHSKDAALGLLTIALFSATTWVALVGVLLGPATPSYFESLRYLTGQFNNGEAAFRFYWTANSLAVFGLLTLAICFTGRVIRARWKETAGAKELLIIGGLAYAAVMLKSGLSRADQWHLDPGIMALALAFLLPLPSRILRPMPRFQSFLGIGCIAVIALTYSFGQLHMAKYVFKKGLIGGYVQLSQEKANFAPMKPSPQAPFLERKVRQPKSELGRLARFMAMTSVRERPVVAYGRTWGVPMCIGVKKTGYLTDNYIYGDERGQRLQMLLKENPNILVLIDRATFDWLQGKRDLESIQPDHNLAGFGIQKELREILSSVHIRSLATENRLLDLRWRKLIGNYVIKNYEAVYQSKSYVVLQRKP